jgi:uncharacterized membrane protein YccC
MFMDVFLGTTCGVVLAAFILEFIMSSLYGEEE